MRRVLWFALLFVVLLGVLAGPIVADAKPEAPRWAGGSCSLVGEVTAHVILVQDPKPKPFELVGVVVAVDGLPNTLLVRVLKGNAIVKPYFGEEISIGVTPNTRYLPPTTKLADLMGVQVKVQGIYTDPTFVGQKITVTSARPKGIAGKEPKASKDPKADDPERDKIKDKGKDKDKGNGAGNRGAAQAPRGKSAPGRTKQKK